MHNRDRSEPGWIDSTLPAPRPVASNTTAAWLRTAARFLLLTLLFSIAYTQSPLYTSNQNQYFLHGLARAGFGSLRQDWLANTLDPTPVFSLLVFLTYRIFHLEALFYVFYALLLGVYLYCLLDIAKALFPALRQSRPAGMIFLALLFAVHSAALRFALSRLLGINWTYVLEDGVADQRLLGYVFQPSVFGVFLLLSAALFLRGRPTLAVLSAALAATFHPTYLLSAALLTLAYMLSSLLAGGKGRTPLASVWRRLAGPAWIGLAALLAVLPILIYVYANFGNTPPATTAQAQAILVDYRIPHHARVSWWFDATAVFKIGLILAALLVVRRSKLFLVLLVPFLGALALTVAQLLLNSNMLALLFPWRVSTLLVPLSTALLLAALVSALAGRFPQTFASHGRLLSALSSGLILAVVAVGAIRFTLDLSRKAAAEERPLQAYVAAHADPGQVYLTPVKMQDFRLAARAPVYIEFKSIPYQDADVLEWYRRMRLADRFYIQQDCSLLDVFAQEKVTRVVLEKDDAANACPKLQPLYQDAAYALYALRAEAP